MDAAGGVSTVASPATVASSRSAGNPEPGFGALLGAMLGNGTTDAPPGAGSAAGADAALMAGQARTAEQVAPMPWTGGPPSASPAPDGTRAPPDPTEEAIVAEADGPAAFAAPVPATSTDPVPRSAPEPPTDAAPADGLQPALDTLDAPLAQATPSTVVPSVGGVLPPPVAPTGGVQTDPPMVESLGADVATPAADRPSTGAAPASPPRAPRAVERVLPQNPAAAEPTAAPPDQDSASSAGMSVAAPSPQVTAPQTIAPGVMPASPRRPATADAPPDPRDAPLAAIAVPPAATGTTAPVPDSPAPSPARAAARAAPTQQVAPVAIALSLDPTSGGRIALQLDPGELGRVEVVVERTRESASVHVAAERPETLALLARDGAQLDRALRDAGIGGDGGRSLSFSLLSDGGAGGQPGDPRGGSGRGWRDAPPPRAEPPRPRDLTTLLDIAI